MTKTGLARSTSRRHAPSGRAITKPTIADLYEQVGDIVSPLELEVRYAELDELVSRLVDIMWTFVGALARAHGYTDADWEAAERSFRSLDRENAGGVGSAGNGTRSTQRRLLIDDYDAYAKRMVLSRI